MRKQHKTIPIFILVAASTQTVVAATNFYAPESSDSITDSTYTELEEVRITDNRRLAPLKSSAPMLRLDADGMLEQGVTDISDAMRRLPGVNLRDYGGSGGMKTVSVRGLGTQHTGIIYDGVPLGDAQSGQIDLSRFSLNNVSSITLNMGDADDIYIPARAISSAVSLSMNTLRMPDMNTTQPELTAKLKAGSFNSWNPAIRFAISNGESLGMSITGDFLHARNDYPFTLFNGTETKRERRKNSQINSGHAEFDGIWKPTAASALQAKLYWYDNSRHLPGPVIVYKSDGTERLREKDIFGQLSYRVKLNSYVSLKAAAKYDNSYTHYTDKNPTYPGGILDQEYRLYEEYVTATCLVSPTTGLQLSYSADFWHNSLSSNLKSNNNPIRNSFLQAVSAKYNIWRLTATARVLYSYVHDHSNSDESKTSTRWSPSVGVSLQPIESEEWRLRASYKNIMRMPTFNELYFDHYGSINLNPEIAEQLNFGTTWSREIASWLPSLGITADGYLNFVKNKIVAMPYNTFVWTMTNLGKVRILGADVTLAADFLLHKNHHLKITGGYSYQRSAPRTNRMMNDWMKQVAYTPLNSGSWSLTWTNPWVNFVVHGTGCSERYSTNDNNPQTRLPGYMDCGLSLYHEFNIKNSTLEVRGDITNILDKQYEIVRRYPMPGRAWSLSVTFNL